MSLRVLFLFGRYLLPRPGRFGPCGFETSKVLDSPDMHAWRSPCFEGSSESIENEEDVISCPGPDDSLPHRIVKVRDLWREQDDFMEELVRPGFYIKKSGNCYVDVVSESAWSILFFCGMLFQTHAGTRSLPVPLVLAMCGRCQRILQESVALRLRLRFCHLLTSGNFGKRKMHGCIPWQRILRHVHKPCLHRLIWQSFGKKKMHGCNPWRSLHARRRILRLLLLHPPPQCWIELLPSKIAWQINRKWRRKKQRMSMWKSSKVVAEREHWNSCAEVSSRERLDVGWRKISIWVVFQKFQSLWEIYIKTLRWALNAMHARDLERCTWRQKECMKRFSTCSWTIDMNPVDHVDSDP